MQRGNINPREALVGGWKEKKAADLLGVGRGHMWPEPQFKSIL